MTIADNLTVQNLDHLGIVAGVVDDIGIVDLINQELGVSSREKVSPGIIVKAMILNGLGFVSAPLYMFANFFTGIATEHLLGEGIKAEYITDDRLGDVLDDLYYKGLSGIFVKVAMKALEKYGVGVKTVHLDSTSFHVDGAYERKEEGSIEITQGYSRDHRPDLKQFMMNLVCVGDGDIPAMMEVVSGNQSDKSRFVEVVQKMKGQFDIETVYVADAALYSEQNIQQMGEMRWLTRVPLNLKTAQELAGSDPEWKETTIKGYRIAEVESNYGGIKQRWILVESSARMKSDQKKLEEKIKEMEQNYEKQMKNLEKQDFACEEDGKRAVAKLSAQMKWYEVTEVEVQEKQHYGKAGKPKKEDVPIRTSYTVKARIKAKEAEIRREYRKCGRFILGTNVLEPGQLRAEEALETYKKQQGTERGFRFLKDPLFFASSVFLKTARRIEALGMIMVLCLLVYNLSQRQLRESLRELKATIPNQLKKPTSQPTLRWIFQCFMAVHLVSVEGAKRIVNLSKERLHILEYFPPSCRRYYLLPSPIS
ncbi:MAG: IS1634 family transposase [Leptolyngbyaceae cyanobacterium RM2_2_4]|nr:IS1634 family transposase [Leptolyngbyaceae cyanobacterium RM2_2_4]